MMFIRILVLAACAMAVACSHSPKTITMKTPEGKQEVMAPLPATLFSMARVLEAQGRHDESEALLRQLVVGRPDYILAYYELSDILARQHRLDDALLVLQAGLKEAPKDQILLNNAGMCELMRKKYDAAFEYFKKASEANPDDTRYKANQALAMAMQGRSRDARAIYATFLTPEQTEQNMQIIEKTRLSEVSKQANK